MAFDPTPVSQGLVASPRVTLPDVRGPDGKFYDGDRRTFEVLVPVLFLVVVVVFFVIAATRESADEQDVWFSAIGAGLGAFALAGAAFAVYRSDVLETARPEVWVELPTSDGADFERLHGPLGHVAGRAHPASSSREFDIRIHVVNHGRTVLRWGKLNIQVLRECQIEPQPLDTGPSDHHRALTPFNSAQLIPGENVPCNATRSEREYAPGHSYLYLARITVPHRGTWPIAAIVDGFPNDKNVTRGEVRADLIVT
jgi:hypothetical protein